MDTAPQPLSRRRRGGQQGNQNARRHGAHSKYQPRPAPLPPVMLTEADPFAALVAQACTLTGDASLYPLPADELQHVARLVAAYTATARLLTDLLTRCTASDTDLQRLMAQARAEWAEARQESGEAELRPIAARP